MSNKCIRWGLLFVPILSCLMWVSEVSAARKLYVLTAVDTLDEKIGKHAKSDVAAVRTLLLANIAEPQLVLMDQLTDAHVTRTDILNSIGQINPTADDAILMYYSGHGGHGGDQQHFLISQGGKERIPRTAVLNAMQAKGFGLVVLVTDSCFSLTASAAPRQGFAMTRSPQATNPLFQQLFFQTNGTIDINSAKQGQVSGTYPNLGQGSIFTKAFCTTFGENKNNGALTWDAVLSKIDQKARADFRQFYPDGYQIETPTGLVNQRDQQLVKLTFDVQPYTPGGSGGNNTNVDNNNNGDNNGGTPPRPSSISSVRLGATVQDQERSGVMIISVTKGGPATKCKDNSGQTFFLEPRDSITAINGVEITDVRVFTDAIRSSPANATITVEGKDGDVHDFTTRLISLGGGGGNPGGDNGDGGNAGGGGNGGNNDNHGTRFGAYVTSGGNRVRVTGLVPDSPAERCRDRNGQTWHLERGDVIRQVNGRFVANEQDYRQAISNSPRQMTLEVLGSDGKSYHFTVTLNY